MIDNFKLMAYTISSQQYNSRLRCVLQRHILFIFRSEIMLSKNDLGRNNSDGAPIRAIAILDD